MNQEENSRVYGRTEVLDNKSRHDHNRTQTLILNSEDDNLIYNVHIENLNKRLEELKEAIIELKKEMNETIRLLKRTASYHEIERLQKRADRIDFEQYLTKSEFGKMISNKLRAQT